MAGIELAHHVVQQHQRSRATRLDQGGTYIDLRDAERREFTATADMTAGDDNWYVPKHDVDYELWNRLIGISNPDRLYQA